MVLLTYIGLGKTMTKLKKQCCLTTLLFIEGRHKDNNRVMAQELFKIFNGDQRPAPVKFS